MIRIHKQGIKPISLTLVFLIIVNVIVYISISINIIVFSIINIMSLMVFTMVTRFFRNPKREVVENPYFILAPADGKIVAIEEIEENEYFKEKRIQISIFMSIYNVHSNKLTSSGKIKYTKYHKGDFLLAKHPKSSVKNERNTVVVETNSGHEILTRQIAGAVARRIICNVKENDIVKQGDEFGFIKFGSRVDIILPLEAKIKVKLQQKVQGSRTVIADLY